MNTEECWEAFDQWCKEYDPEGELSSDMQIKVYTTDTARIVAERQLEALKPFVQAIVRTRCWGVEREEDGGTIQELAEKHGIIVPFVITQEQEDNDEIEGGVAGDTAFEFADWMRDTKGTQ